MAQRRVDLRDTIEALTTLPDSVSDTVHVALSRYLVIRSAGYIEAVRDDVADIFTSQQSSPEITRRVQHNLRGGQGVRPSQLLEFVKSYSPVWYEELDSLFRENDNALKEALGALVSARKKIAHGDGEQVTMSKAIRWAESAQTVSKWLTDRFDPNRNSRERMY